MAAEIPGDGVLHLRAPLASPVAGWLSRLAQLLTPWTRCQDSSEPYWGRLLLGGLSIRTHEAHLLRGPTFLAFHGEIRQCSRLWRARRDQAAFRETLIAPF